MKPKRKLPQGCTIVNIRFGVRPGTEDVVYANLIEPGPYGGMIISATLIYITRQIEQSELVSPEEWKHYLNDTGSAQ
jgi:hypothetical protein